MSNTVNNYTETDLGNISLNPRGEYDNSAAYEYLDTVSYRGGSYFCRAELETTITGIAPDAGRDSEHWQMIAAPGDMTPEYTAAYNDVINKAAQVEISRAAVELAQQEIEADQTDVQQLHSDTVQMAQQAENSKNSAANSAQSAEQSRKTVSESEQNINGQIAGFDSRVFEAVEQSKEEINTTKQQAIDTITNQQDASVNIVKTEGEKIITKVGNDAKTVADDRATVEEATQTVLNNAQEVAQNTQTVAGNTEKAVASAESAKTSADNAAQSAKSVEDASKQIEQNKKDVDSLKEDIVKANKAIETNSKEDDKNKRKLDALWDLNRGVSYQFESDSEKAYQKKVPSGAKLMSITNIGGNTIESSGKFIDTKVDRIEIIGRNLFDENQKPQDITTPDGIRKGIIVGKGLGEVFASANNDSKYDVYYYLCCIKSDGSFRTPINYFIIKDNVSCGSFYVESDEELFVYSAASSDALNKIKNLKVQIEKGTVQTEYTPYFKETIFIPESVKKMQGYGISAGSINNILDFENMRFVERIGILELGQLTWYKFPDENKKIFYAELSGALNANRILLSTKYNLTGDAFNDDKTAKITGNILYIQDSDFMTESDFSSSVLNMKMYYEYTNEVITDISNEIEKLNTSLIQTKDGTTISFINDRKDDTPVYSSIEYITSLSEVNA